MINVVLEGESDREAAKAIVRSVGRAVAYVYVAGGKTRLDPKIPKYNAAAQRSPWVVFRDSDGQCPVELRDRLMATTSSVSPRFALRIAHSMTEAWLLADREGFAKFFHVRPGRIPTSPEGLDHAKQALLSLCAASSSRAIRADVVRPGGQTGPLYVARVNEFARQSWNVESAAHASPSLARAMRAIDSLPSAAS